MKVRIKDEVLSREGLPFLMGKYIPIKKFHANTVLVEYYVNNELKYSEFYLSEIEGFEEIVFENNDNERKLRILNG